MISRKTLLKILSEDFEQESPAREDLRYALFINGLYIRNSMSYQRHRPLLFARKALRNHFQDCPEDADKCCDDLRQCNLSTVGTTKIEIRLINPTDYARHEPTPQEIKF